MSDILADLTTDNNTPAPDAADTPNESPGGGDIMSVVRKNPFLAALSVGKIPAVSIPSGAKLPTETDLTPAAFQALGLSFYKASTDKSVQGAVFNPKVTSAEGLKKLDKAGKLGEALPPITAFLNDSAEGSPDAASAPGSDDDQAPQAENPPASVPSSNPVPVLPRPAMGAGAQRATAQTRLKNLNAQKPTAQKIPGAGNLLNGLMNHAV